MSRIYKGYEIVAKRHYYSVILAGEVYCNCDTIEEAKKEIDDIWASIPVDRATVKAFA